MTQPSVGPERRYTTQPRTPEETAEFFKNNPPAEPTLEQIHKRLNLENIDLRGQLEMARKATSAAQELLEAARMENVRLNDKWINADEARTANGRSAVEFIGRIKELRKALDTEKLLRTNDASTIADLERRLREAEGQLRAQRTASAKPWGGGSWVNAEWAEVKIAEVKANGEAQVSEAVALISQKDAELEEMRRTFRLIVGTTKEYFDLITELASDPADEKRKEPKP